MIAVKKHVGILQKNIFLLNCILEYTFENKIIIISASTSLPLTKSRKCRYNNINGKYDSVIRNNF